MSRSMDAGDGESERRLMARHDYRCPDCGAVAEFRDRDAPYCPNPECFSVRSMVKLPSAPNFVLKGSGFHSVDYPKNKK